MHGWMNGWMSITKSKWDGLKFETLVKLSQGHSTLKMIGGRGAHLLIYPLPLPMLWPCKSTFMLLIIKFHYITYNKLGTSIGTFRVGRRITVIPDNNDLWQTVWPLHKQLLYLVLGHQDLLQRDEPLDVMQSS